MTSVEDTLAGAPTAPVPAVGPVSAPSGDRTTSRWRRAVGIGFVALIVIVVAVFLVEGPIAGIWYSFRQEHLSSQFQNPGRARTGSPLAVIQVPKRSFNVLLVQGDGPGVMRAGPGHQPSTPLPGNRGNSVIFGHRDAWGGPFKDLGQLQRGDSLFLQRRARTGDLVPLFFKIVSIRTEPASDLRPYDPSTDHRLTLVTSAGGDRRLIVTAVSGTVGRLEPPTARTSGSLGGAGGTVGYSLTWLAVSAGLGASVVLLVRRRHRATVAAVAVAPFALGGLLCLILAGDALLAGRLS